MLRKFWVTLREGGSFCPEELWIYHVPLCCYLLFSVQPQDPPKIQLRLWRTPASHHTDSQAMTTPLFHTALCTPQHLLPMPSWIPGIPGFLRDDSEPRGSFTTVLQLQKPLSSHRQLPHIKNKARGCQDRTHGSSFEWWLEGVCTPPEAPSLAAEALCCCTEHPSSPPIGLMTN